MLASTANAGLAQVQVRKPFLFPKQSLFRTQASTQEYFILQIRTAAWPASPMMRQQFAVPALKITRRAVNQTKRKGWRGLC
jgi:hypothetical protein